MSVDFVERMRAYSDDLERGILLAELEFASTTNKTVKDPDFVAWATIISFAREGLKERRAAEARMAAAREVTA